MLEAFAIRLHPGQDLRRELVAVTAQRDLRAGLILTCVGSLRRAALRLANRPGTSIYEDCFEILSLVGTLGPDGPHLHIALADGRGVTIGGHLQEGSLIYTTAEIVIGELTNLAFARPLDPGTGYDELTIEPRAAPSRPRA